MCQGVTKMPTQLNGGTEAFTWSNITNNEIPCDHYGQSDAGRDAGSYLYLRHWLGRRCRRPPQGTEQFLSTLANDPAGPATYGCTKGVYSAATLIIAITRLSRRAHF